MTGWTVIFACFDSHICAQRVARTSPCKEVLFCSINKYDKRVPLTIQNF